MFVTPEPNNRHSCQTFEVCQKYWKYCFIYRLRSIINLRLSFKIARTQNVPIYGWTDEVSKNIQNWVHNRCDMSANWAWLTFLKRYVISVLNFHKYLIIVPRQVYYFIKIVNEPYYFHCMTRYTGTCDRTTMGLLLYGLFFMV